MKLRVLEKSFIGNTIVEPGAIVELPDGAEYHTNLEPIEDEAPAAKAGKGGKAKGAEEPLA